jgi:O-antigen/teichoic acid export membrane protein
MIVAGVGGFAADYALNLGAARLLAPHDYGDFKVALAYLNLATLLVLLGGDRAAPRFLASWLQEGDGTGVWEYVRFYLLVLTGLSVLLIGGTFLASYLHFGPVDLAHHHPLLIAALVVPIGAVSTLLARVFLAAKHLGRANLPWRIGYPLTKLGLILASATILGGITDFGALWIAMVAATAMLGYQVFELRRLSLMPFVRAQQLATPRSWIVASIPMMMVLLLQMGVGQVDIFMLELLGGETEVGHFGAASTTVRSLVLVQNTALGLVAPLMTAALKQGPEQVMSMHVRGFRMLFMLSLPVALVLIVFGSEILTLFGPSYVAAYPALIVLTCGFLLSTQLALSAYWLQYAGQERLVMKVMIASLVVVAILNAILIPPYGMIGAAASTCIVLVGSAVAFSLLLRRHLGVSPWPIVQMLRGQST